MKKAAPQPATLFEACMQQEQSRHARRIKEIKSMEARLAMLDAYMPAIRAAGLTLWLRDLESNYGDKALRLTCGIFCSLNHQRLLDLLLGQGFNEVERNEHGSFSSVVVGKGRLRLHINVDKPLELAIPAPDSSPAAAVGVPA
ncbi:hypothetical protein LJR084_001197 [Variovorax sp. LjRoot84]|uniref:hypothetical protein n=1 Tax=Variovorax sp. LjRoot84 TaxID=3342340 RepID=UPI003ECFD7B3